MSKTQRKWIAVLSVAGALALLFLLFLGLTIPFGARGHVISGKAFAVLGGSVAGIFLAAAAFFFIRRKK